ncbi:hypothetical protein P4S63_01875 [Pseudoalteromonas sp. B193]
MERGGAHSKRGESPKQARARARARAQDLCGKTRHTNQKTHGKRTFTQQTAAKQTGRARARARS